MDEVRVELLDLHSEVKCSVFGICCLATLLTFLYVLYRLAVSPSRMPWNELSVILLSCTQLLFGIIFYFGSQHPFLQILNKAIKVAQAEIISWSCLNIMLINNSHRRYMARVMLHLISGFIAAALAYSYFTVYNHTIYLNAKIGIFMSSTWCAISMGVIYVAHKIRKNLDVSMLLRTDDPVLDESGMRRNARMEHIGRDLGDLVESYSETKYQQLLLLVIVEGVTAAGTLVWDVILYYSIQQSLGGKGLELNMPLLKEVLYIASNTILVLIPNWTVFYVFYWVQRHNYSKISSTWDINLNSIQFDMKVTP
uniref:Putative conserved plasma membrane protein n=1 Tax=Amblyomma aureolatum TaxID=187763 RepID=A0A1E1XH40_9ACAR